MVYRPTISGHANTHHDQKPTHKATIVDNTCDSDGCLERFIDHKDFRQTLDLHAPSHQPYLGFFLVGAYRKALQKHNLFGAINEAEVYIDEKGVEIDKTTIGDPIEELLTSKYNQENYEESYRAARFFTKQDYYRRAKKTINPA